MATGPVAPGADRTARGLLMETLSDALAYLSATDLLRAIALPANPIVAFGRALAASGERPAEDAPAQVWDALRRRQPRAAAFPLGPATERAVKRSIAAICRLASGPDGAHEGTPATRPYLAVVHGYLAEVLFEISMLNLRSSSDHADADYGYRYHWPRHRWRPLPDETQMRRRLARESSELAARVIRTWAALKRPAPFCPDRREIEAVATKVFHVVLAPSTVRPHGERRAATVVGMRPSSSEEQHAVGPIAYDARPIVFRGRAKATQPGTVKNADVDVDAIASACDQPLHPLIQDLVEIAATVYLADVYVERAPSFERELVLAIPVTYPEIWTRHERALAHPVSLLTGNNAVFRFTGAERAPRPARFPTASDARCLALLSGGLDSFAGAIHLLDAGREPTFVSHTPSPALTGIQREVARPLARHYRAFNQVSIYAGPARGSVAKFHRLGSPPEQVLYQHGRSFLFLALAAAIALSKGIRDIVVSENGPVALNPSFSEARFNTKTTHPAFFAMFEDLVRLVFDTEIRIDNPFALQTKGEVTATIADRWSAHVKKTNSCWSYSKVALWAKSLNATGFTGRHCGRCVPCLWRRTSTAHAGLTEADDSYLADVLSAQAFDQWMSRRHLTVLADQVRFSANALAMPDDALIDLCPDFHEIGPGTLKDRLSMYRRFSKEILAWVESSRTPLATRLAVTV